MPEDENSTGRSVNRRSILRGIGISTSGMVGFAGTAAASGQPSDEDRTELQELADSYDSADNAMEDLLRYGSTVVDELKEREIISDESNLSYKSEIKETTDERKETNSLSVNAYKIDGTNTARITRILETDDHRIELFVHPQANVHYASIEELSESYASAEELSESAPNSNKSEGFAVVDDGSPSAASVSTVTTESCQPSSGQGPVCRYSGGRPCCPDGFGCLNTEYERITCDSGDCYAGIQLGTCCQLADSC